MPPLPIGELLLRGATAARRRGSRRADQPFLCLLLEQAVLDDLRPFEQPGDLLGSFEVKVAKVSEDLTERNLGGKRYFGKYAKYYL